jgi:hypothetical protein
MDHWCKDGFHQDSARVISSVRKAEPGGWGTLFFVIRLFATAKFTNALFLCSVQSLLYYSLKLSI